MSVQVLQVALYFDDEYFQKIIVKMTEIEGSLTLSRDIRRACELLEKLQVQH